MKFNLILVAAVGFLASTVTAGISTTSPYDKITWNGGNTESVTWQDDGKSPKLANLKQMTIQLMTGNVNQIVVATIAKNVAGTALKVTYPVPKTVGPPGNFYFIKYTSGTYTAFSGRFTIQGVSGNIPGFDPNAPLSDPPTTTPTNSTSDSSSPSDSSNNSTNNSSSDTGSSGTSGNSIGSSNTGSTSSASSSLSAPTNSKSSNSTAKPSSDASSPVFLSTPTLASLALGVVAIAMTLV